MSFIGIDTDAIDELFLDGLSAAELNTALEAMVKLDNCIHEEHIKIQKQVNKAKGAGKSKKEFYVDGIPFPSAGYFFIDVVTVPFSSYIETVGRASDRLSAVTENKSSTMDEMYEAISSLQDTTYIAGVFLINALEKLQSTSDIASVMTDAGIVFPISKIQALFDDM